MKRPLQIIIIAVVVIAAAAVLVYKQRPAPVSVAAPPSAAVTRAAATGQHSILLFANLREAGSDDPCAAIIDVVRQARQRGVMVTEIDEGASPQLREKYRVVVEPTVIVIDDKGAVITRHEGEDSETVTAVRDAVGKLTGGRA